MDEPELQALAGVDRHDAHRVQFEGGVRDVPERFLLAEDDQPLDPAERLEGRELTLDRQGPQEVQELPDRNARHPFGQGT